MTAGLTRRNFVRLAVGTLMPLARVAGGYVVPAQAQELSPAEAASGTDASEAAASAEPEVVITLVFANEVGLYVGDTSRPSNPPVAGAHVQLTSRYNGKRLEGDTGDDGICKFNVEELSENPDGLALDRLERYEFNGSVEVTCPGYREFATGLMRIQGGLPLFVPTCPLDGATPYPRLVGFNEWDGLYTRNEFIIASENTESHDIRVQWAQVTSSAATVQVRDNASGKIVGTADVRPEGGLVEATFTDAYLLRGAGSCLSAGGTLDVLLTEGDTTYQATLNLTVREGAADGARSQSGVTLNPLNTNASSTTGVKGIWPKDVPIFGGTQLNSFAPDMMVNLSFNPWGFLQLTVRSPSWGYKKDTGKDEGEAEGGKGKGEGSAKKSGWGKYPRQSAKEQYDSLMKTAKSMSNAAGAAVADGGNVSKIDTFGAVSATLTFQLVIAALWDNDQHLFQGNAGVQAFLALNLSYTMNYLVGPLPVLVTFALDASVIFALSAGFYVKAKDGQKAIVAFTNFSDYHWDLSNTGFTITINIAPSITVGIGIRGVASISVQGKVNIIMVFGWDFPVTEKSHDLPLPHRVYYFGFQLFVVVHLFLITLNFKVLDVPFGDPIDNWKGEFDAQSQEDLLLRALARDPDLVDALVPITSSMLEKTCEYVLSDDEDDPFATQSDQPSFDWSCMRQEDIEATTREGVSVRYAVYRLVTDEVGDDAADGTGDSEVLAGQTGPTVSRRNMRAPRYVALHAGEDGYSFVEGGTPLPEPGVAGRGRKGGVVPSADKVLADAVFGDPRMKVVEISSMLGSMRAHVTCCLRITSVNIGSTSAPAMRSRLTMTILDCSSDGQEGSVDLSYYLGTSVVVDFDVDDAQVARRDLFDYDFDVALSTSMGVDVVHLVLVSGRRTLVEGTAGNAEKVADIASDLYFTYLCFRAVDAFAAGGLTYMCKQTRSAANDLSMGADDAILHSISNLELATDGTDDTKSLLVCYLDRMSKTADGLILGGGGVHSTRVCMFVVDLEDEPVQLVPDRRLIDEHMSDFSDDVYQFYLSPCMDHKGTIGRVYTLTLTDDRRSYFYIVALSIHERTGLAVFDSIRRCAVADTRVRLVPWPGQDLFLCSYPVRDYLPELAHTEPDEWDRTRWHLHTARWVEGSGSPELEATPAGPENFNIASFGTNTSGTFIFWPQTRQADPEGLSNRTYNADLSHASEPEEALEHLMACRIRDGHFSDPFIAADLPHRLDGLQIVKTYDRLSPLELVSYELYATGETDRDGNDVYHAGRLWYTAIPNVSFATVVGAVSPMPLVRRGATVCFHVTVRNDGNCYLKGCTLEMYVHTEVETGADGRVVKERVSLVEGSAQEVTFVDAIVESAYNPLENGKLLNTEPDGSLAPGKCSAYKVYVKIPDAWGADGTDSYPVSFRARDPQIAEGGIMGQAEDVDGVGWPTDEGAVFQDFAVEPGDFEPFAYASTTTTERHVHHMATLTLDGVAMEDRWGAAPVVSHAKGEPAEEDDTHGGGANGGTSRAGTNGHRVPASGGADAVGGYRWYESMTRPYRDPTHADVVSPSGTRPASGTSSGSSTPTASGTGSGGVPGGVATNPAAPATGTGTSGQGSPTATQAAGVATTAAQAGALSGAATPWTADATPHLLPAALAAAGAGIVAYERRRAKDKGD